MSIAAPGTQRLFARYAEVLPTGRLCLEGTITIGKRAMHLDLRESGGDAHFAAFLFLATSPVTVLGGIMCGVALIPPDVQPSFTRIAMVRLPGISPRLREAAQYLPPTASTSDNPHV